MRVTSRLFYGYWIVFAGLITLTMNTGLTFYGFTIFNPQVADDLSWSRSEVTAAFLFFLMVAGAISPIAGRLGDKWGPRKVLVLGTVAMSFGLLLLSRTSALWHFYLLHLCLGIGYVFLGPVPFGHY